jgi:hypothetical protein
MSDRRLWWRCEQGHEWQAIVKNVVRSTGCPFCIGRRVSPEDNFATCFPQLVGEWDYERNEGTPDQYRPFSDYKALWRGIKIRGQAFEVLTVE